MAASFEILQETDGGYAKVKYTGIGTVGYRDLNAGEATSQNAFAGSRTQEEYNPVLDPETGDIQTNVPENTTVEVTPEFNTITRQYYDSESYAKVYKVDYQEPHELGYETPLGFPEGYFIEDYPENTRIEQLMGEINDPDIDKWTFGVHTVLVANNGARISEGNNFVNHTETTENLKPAFLTLIEEIRKRLNSSPGNDIIVTKTMVRGFEYTEDYR